MSITSVSASASPAGSLTTSDAASPAHHDADGAQSPFAKVLRRLGDEAERGEKFMHDAKHAALAGAMGQAELLEVQAGVYRYGLAVDLTSKVVAETTNGLKTIVEAQ